ncbi:MAG TPA: ABC transporter ATP-binding protein [Gammaproteobacteria bacterium]|nr:ABC transporter ATP-binding protein [Xanthomonadales bacterium]HOP21811.1 ABC transporter ATP-binding protein [Gammaproteobacteria bacterium]HPI94962.1 ABC transporter ATP-binding protein [Gammaproteobacteria bacterium]HPQ86228.1 ABC transporter ATP-binding protein [Gammaproteobacteria bacterium]
MKAILQASNINKLFKIENQSIEILKNVSFQINQGEFVAIMGKSGSGKSTLLSILAGLDQPDSGSVKLDQLELTDLSENQLAKSRQQDIGFVFQSFYLIPTLTVEENIAFPLQINRSFDAKRMDELIEKVGLSDRKKSFPHQLSGGEKQRTAIARALISQPKILFADEPTGNLDERNAESVLNLLIELQKEFQTALVVVTHDAGIANRADRVIEIHDGKIL